MRRGVIVSVGCLAGAGGVDATPAIANTSGAPLNPSAVSADIAGADSVQGASTWG